ncbi:MAG: acyltransferase 3 [Solirubrobacterales bacterium]|nr:acyltransferase 3 [Solirubrobacterales bacterium]
MTRLFLGLLTAMAVAVGWPSVAQAGCGGVVAAPAQGASSTGRPPLTIGDSTSILSVPVLGALGVEANARGCRQFSEGLQLMRARRAAGTLPAVVVVALGANGPVTDAQLTHARALVGSHGVLLLVTARRSEPRNVVLRAAARAHPDQLLLVDWVAASRGHPEWFSGDGLHVSRPGAVAFAKLIRRAVARFAFPPVRRLHVPRRKVGARDCGLARPGRRAYVLRGPVTCTRARQLARAPATRAVPGWTAFDWRRTRRGPWAWVIERADRRVVVAVAG